MKLSEFKDEKGIEVIGKLMSPITAIIKTPGNEKAAHKSYLDFASAILQHNAKEVKEMLAILDDKDPEDYHCNAATVIFDVLNMLNDPVLMQLFGLQSETTASSGSV